MAHDARVVANSLIERSVEEETPLTPLQIIKLVYMCHGWMLGLYNHELSEQKVLAWIYGPVIADVYRSLRKYGRTCVSEKIYIPDEEFSDLEVDLIMQVYRKYSPFSGIQLSALTHAPGTPWHKIWHRRGRNSIIPNSLIASHYAGVAERANS